MNRIYMLALAAFPVWAYALIRYVLVGTTPASRIPAWISNKTFGVAAVFLLGLSLVSRDPITRCRAGAMSLWIMALHGVLSLILLSPSYYTSLFQADGTLTVLAELSLLSGAIGSVLMIRLYLKTIEKAWSQKHEWVARAVLGISAAHTLFLGLPGWLKPASWPGGLPPITLLSCFGSLLLLEVFSTTG